MWCRIVNEKGRYNPSGLNTVMNDAKTNLIDIIDGGFNSVRNFGGESKLRPIIDGTEPADNGFIEY